MAVVQGVGMTPGFMVPRQNNEFYYLCGVETPGAYLMLDGRTRTAALYLPRRNTRLEAAEGRVLSADDAELARRLTGVDQVHPVEAMRESWPPTAAAPILGAPDHRSRGCDPRPCLLPLCAWVSNCCLATVGPLR